MILATALGANLIPNAHAQKEPSPESDPLNHAYSVYLGSGFYTSNDRSVFVLRIAPRFRIRSEDEHAFGIRVRINGTFGFYDLNPGDFADLVLPSSVNTFALVPGVEFPIRIYPNWTFSPFLDVGPAVDTATEEITVVVGVGFRSRAEWNTDRHRYLLWNELILANNVTDNVANRSNYNVLRTDFEVRGLVDYRMFKRDFDLGVLAGIDLIFDPLVIPSFGENATKEISRRFEIGVTTGSLEKWKPFKKIFSTPRLGLSYRFGQDVSAIRFLIRSRY